MACIAEVFGLKQVSAKQKLMGIEVELENFRHPEQPPEQWNVIPDHSLRNNGVEFVLKKPLGGSVLTKAIEDLCSYVGQGEYALTHRCSVHVHIDFRDKEVEDVEKFLLLYMLLEPALYTMSSKDRYNNIYCPGLTHTTELIKTAASSLYENDLQGCVMRWNKYTGINLHPLHNLGSVEIRTHGGSASFEDIHSWVEVLEAVTHAATYMSIEEINKVSSADELVCRVFPEHLQSLVLCDNLIRYWPNAKLNLHYYNLVQDVISRQPKPLQTGTLDFEAIQNLIR